MSKIIPHDFHPDARAEQITELVEVIADKVEEDSNVNVDQELKTLFQLSGHKAIRTDFQDYWNRTSLDDLALTFIIKPAPKAVVLSRADVIDLLRLYQENLDDDVISGYYLDYLDANLPVAVTDVIFDECDTDDVDDLADALLKSEPQKPVKL